MYKVMYTSNASYVLCRAVIYYYTRRIPNDVRQFYASSRRHLFERFEQGQPSAKRSREGAGLGLAIVKKKIAFHIRPISLLTQLPPKRASNSDLCDNLTQHREPRSPARKPRIFAVASWFYLPR